MPSPTDALSSSSLPIPERAEADLWEIFFRGCLRIARQHGDTPRGYRALSMCITRGMECHVRDDESAELFGAWLTGVFDECAFSEAGRAAVFASLHGRLDMREANEPTDPMGRLEYSYPFTVELRSRLTGWELKLASSDL